jgi:exodeoxyribonuclease-3
MTKIVTWNVNGIRAIIKKGFLDIFLKLNADIFCLQEVKAFLPQLPLELSNLPNYDYVFHQGQKAGYAGVSTFSKLKIKSFKNTFKNYPNFFEDGRMIETQFTDFILLNIYFPNGGTKANGQEMLSYKLKFYEDLIEYLKELKKKNLPIIITGDFNICHTKIDIARPEDNKNSIGFLPIEREMFSKLLKQGFKDVFREFYPQTKEVYSWWSYRTRARERNIGWRLDYFLVSEDFLVKIKKITYHNEIFGSDHCPVSLEF